MSDPLAATFSALTTRNGPTEAATSSQIASSPSLATQWNHLLRGTTTSPKEALKLRAVEGKIAQDQSASLRWIQWKSFLAEHISSIPSSWSATLNQERDAYNELRCRLLRAPDGNYPPEVGFDGTHTTLDSASASSSSRQHPGAASIRRTVVHDLSVNNPLSLDDSNPWTAYYTTFETRRIILQDVERTFPELDLFRQTHVQQSLTNILFLWTLENEDVGYRQGMHELAAALWKVRSDGAVDARGLSGSRSSASAQNSVEAPFQLALADVFIEHDVNALFRSLMQSAKSWFVWRDSPSAPIAPAASTSPPSASLRQSPTQRRSAEAARPPLPIVAKCEHILDLLRHIDPALAQHLQSLGIEPQIFCLRWIRMIFTREFALDDAFAIWDGLFATGLDLIDYVCLAMLLRIRNQLLAGDHTSALQSLLRYPAEAQAQPSLLVRQAIFMRDSALQPSTGVAVVMQNRDLLGIAVQAVDSQIQGQDATRQAPASPTQRFNAQKFATVGRSPSGPATRASPWARMQDGNSSPQNGRQPAARRWQASGATADPLGASQGSTSLDANGQRAFGINPTAYLPEGISDMAKGWYERSELPQSLNSALANVQRTVAAAANAYGSAKVEKSGFPSGFEQAFSSQTGLRAASSSNLDRASPAPSPRPAEQQLPIVEPQEPASPPSQRHSANLVQGVSKTTTANKAIGSALTACIEVLEQSWLDRSRISGKQSQEDLDQSDLNTLMSFTALKHIRDVLEGTATEFDPATLPAPIVKPTAPSSEVAKVEQVPQQSSIQQPPSYKPDAIRDVPPKNGPSLPMSLPEYARYGRQMILPDFGLPGQLRLRASKVLVVGAGGLGCPAIQYLAAAGVGQISILDHDVVEPSNLARQILHSDATVGQPKANSAADAARRINPYITAIPLVEAISAHNARQHMRGQDLVLDCTDNPLTRYLISDAAVLEGVQVVSGAAQGYDGQLVVLHKRIKAEFAAPKARGDGEARGPCYRCLFPQAPRPDEVTNCEDGGVLGGVTGLVGTMQALEAVKILARIGEDTPPMLTLLSPLTGMPFRCVKIRPRRVASCRACGDPAQVAEPMIRDLESEDYVSFCGLTPTPAEKEGPRTQAAAMQPALIVDVRPEIEFGIAKLDGSINVPIQTLLRNPAQAWKRIHEAQPAAGVKEVLVVCKKGNDSRVAVRELLRVKAEGEAAPVDPLQEAKGARGEVRPVKISDLVGGLRAYSRERDPGFPVY